MIFLSSAGLFLLSFLLRIYILSKNLFFTFEQGRDMQIIQKIVFDHKLTLIGPRTSVEGIFHGPLYYYLSSLPFLFSQGNPLFIMYFFIFWQSLGAIFFYFLIKDAFNKKAAVWGSLLYVVSYGLIVYSRWFSHPPLIIPFSILFFWSLLKISKNQEKFYLLAALSWTAIFHLDLVVAIFFLPGTVAFFFWQKLKKPSFTVLLSTVLILFLFFSSYFLFDFRHDFLMFNSLKRFLLSSLRPSSVDLLKVLQSMIDRYTLEIQDVLGANLPNFTVYFFFIPLFFLFFKRKKIAGEKLLLIWLTALPTIGMIFSPLFGLKHYLVGLGPGMIMLIVWWLTRFDSGIKKNLANGLLIFLILNNLWLVKNWLPINRNIFYLLSHQGMILSNQLKTVDYIYQSAGQKDFSYELFTIPYWSQAGWQYLFSWYGAKRYGFLPKEMDKTNIFYIIIEPGGDKLYLDNWLKEKIDPKGKTIEEMNFGGIRVQKRKALNL